MMQDEHEISWPMVQAIMDKLKNRPRHKIDRQEEEADRLFAFVLEKEKKHLECCMKKMLHKIEDLREYLHKLKHHIAKCIAQRQKCVRKYEETADPLYEKKIILLDIEIAIHVAKFKCLKGKKMLALNHLDDLTQIDNLIP